MTMAYRRTLNAEQIRSYHEQGYAPLGSILSPDELSAIRSDELRLRSFTDLEAARARSRFNIFMNRSCHYSEPLRGLCTRGLHLQAVRQIIGPNVCFWHDQFVIKLPDDGTEDSVFPWHQDNAYTCFDPPTNLTVWTALDDVGHDNGCVWVIPASHRRGLLPHSQQEDRFAGYKFVEPQNEDAAVPLILKTGEAVVFSGSLLHRSTSNKTDRPRRALFMEYCDAGATYSPHDQPVTQSAYSWVVAGQAPWRAPCKEQ